MLGSFTNPYSRLSLSSSLSKEFWPWYDWKFLLLYVLYLCLVSSSLIPLQHINYSTLTADTTQGSTRLVLRLRESLSSSHLVLSGACSSIEPSLYISSPLYSDLHQLRQLVPTWLLCESHTLDIGWCYPLLLASLIPFLTSKILVSAESSLAAILNRNTCFIIPFSPLKDHEHFDLLQCDRTISTLFHAKSVLLAISNVSQNRIPSFSA